MIIGDIVDQALAADQERTPRRTGNIIDVAADPQIALVSTETAPRQIWWPKMSVITAVLLVVFLVMTALSRRRRRSSRYRVNDAEQYVAGLSPTKGDDLVARQPAPFIPEDGPYIGGAPGYGRGGFGGRWDGLPRPDAAQPPAED